MYRYILMVIRVHKMNGDERVSPKRLTTSIRKTEVGSEKKMDEGVYI